MREKNCRNSVRYVDKNKCRKNKGMEEKRRKSRVLEDMFFRRFTEMNYDDYIFVNTDSFYYFKK